MWCKNRLFEIKPDLSARGRAIFYQITNPISIAKIFGFVLIQIFVCVYNIVTFEKTIERRELTEENSRKQLIHFILFFDFIFWFIDFLMDV